MPKFLLQIVGPAGPSDDYNDQSLAATMKLHEEFIASLDAAPGAEMLASEALDYVSTATFLRATCSPSVEVFDNPNPELKEALGGFYLISAQSAEQAVELAKRVPSPNGWIEVRPVVEFD